MQLKGILFGLAIAFALPAAASATDLFVPEESYVAPAEPGFDWGGFYLGVYGGLEAYPGPFNTWGQLGKFIGVNAVLGEAFLLGAEAQIEAAFAPGSGYAGWQAFLAARAGVILGDDDQFLLYAIAGVGHPFFGGTEPDLWMAGGGFEWAMGEQVSLRGELTGRGCIDDSWLVCTTPTWANAKGGLVWHL